MVASAAIVVSGSALVGAAPQWGGSHHGGDSNYGPDSSMSVYQFGPSDVANALQSDAYKSDVTIIQHEHGNGAAVGQGTDDSTISLKQTGFQNSADINQWNVKNVDISVTQLGGRNGAVVNQTASDPNVLIQQAGHGNNAIANQHQFDFLTDNKQGENPVFFRENITHTPLLIAALANQITFNITQQGDMYTIIPQVTLAQPYVCEVQAPAVRKGKGGQSQSQQKISLSVPANRPIELTKMSLNIPPEDSVKIIVTISDGQSLHPSQQWPDLNSHP